MTPSLPATLRGRTIVAASYVLMAAALLLVLTKGMLVALLTGLLVFCLINQLAPVMEKHFHKQWAKLGAVLVLSAVVVGSLVLTIWGIVHFFQSDAGSIPALLQKLADILEASRRQLPPWLAEHLPHSADELNALLVEGLREHANEAKTVSTHVGHVLMHIVLGMLIGVMVALADTAQATDAVKPLASALSDRIARLAQSFQNIVFAQVKISAINSVITGIYVFVILPVMGVSLPFKTTIVLVTFLGGLLPVAGNLIANTLLVVVALSHSLHAAVGSLVFMVVVHKLEYFLNARIIGQSISAKAWELLTAMLVMETLFGIPGIVAAPILYAYVKSELMQQDLV